MILPAIMGATARRFDPDTVLLLPMTGANDSTTFTDKAKGGNAPHTVTANGDAKIVTAQADPFSVSNGVGYFDTNNSHLSWPGSADFAFGTTMDFTVEFWLRYTSSSQFNWNIGTLSGSNLVFDYNDSGYDYWLYWRGNGQYYIRGSKAEMRDGNWHHHAIVRRSVTMYYYFDGISLGSNSTAANGTMGDTANINWPAAVSTVPCNFSDLAITRRAKYPANFTPPARLKP